MRFAQRPLSRALVVAAALAAAAAVVAVDVACRSGGGGRPRPPTGASVHGSVVARARVQESKSKDGGALRQIALPDFKVTLRDVGSGASVSVSTDVFGRYAFPVQKPGTYELSWPPQDGWAAGVYPEPVVIWSNTKYPKPIEAAAVRRVVVAGRVRLADGSIPTFIDPATGKRETPRLSAVPAGGGAALWTRRLNVSGEFALADVAPGQDLQAQFQSAFAATALLPADLAGAKAPLLVFKNSAPRIVTLAAVRAGVGIRGAAGGDTVELVAQVVDPDGDAVTYDWRADEQSGTVAPTVDGRAKWTLPSGAGGRRVYLTVNDKKGGVASRSLGLTLDLKAERFSGRVVEMGGPPLAGTEVEINGTTTTSAAGGWFRMDVAPARRYVMNIRKPGYALCAKVFDKPSNGATWELVRAHVETVDPKRDVVVVDRAQRKVRGVRVTLGPGALVDPAGNAPSGPLTATVATYDIARQMPGADGAIDGGREALMLSYGAAFIEFTDGAGTRYQIAKGQAAGIEMPVPDAFLAKAPKQIAVWSYDEKDGYWKRSGDADLDAAARLYRGKVSHLSAVNTDIASVDAACLKVVLDPTIPVGTCSLRATWVSGPQPFGQSKILPLDETENAFYRLPANSQIKLELLDDATLAVIGNLEVLDGAVVAPNDTIDTGPALPPGADLWPDPPYASCKVVTVRLAVPDGGPFLELAFNGDIGTQAEADFYYTQVAPATGDPNTQRLTLGQWWAVNGFSAVDGTAADEARQAYLNYNDLGFGRDMHMRKDVDGSGNVLRVAAYVTNYFDAAAGPGDQNPANADYAEDRQADKRIATVCMEYSPIEGDASGDMVVKFFVYGAGTGAFGPDGARLSSADLDGFGQKFVPKLCLNCHGGDFARLNDAGLTDLQRVKLGSVFREFDAPTFRYPSGVVTLPPGDPIHANLKALNLLARDTCETPGAGVEPQTVRGGVIRELIDGWYVGGGVEQDNTWAPDPWKVVGGAPAQAEALYQKVFAVSCRTCHAALSEDVGHFGITWRRYDDTAVRSGGFDYVVCGSNRFMPHAKVTFRNFWLETGPHKPTTLRDFSAPGWTTETGPCGE
jgi:hypothetical protein